MIEKCNFKQNKSTLMGQIVLDCALGSPLPLTGAFTCVGEENCILYQMYRQIAESTL
jgi:hypothetical protein